MTQTFSRKHFVKKGQTFGKWTVLEPHTPVPSRSVCKCECGELKILINYHLIANQTTKCLECARVDRRQSVLYKGERIDFSTICKQLNISQSTIRHRSENKCCSLQKAFDYTLAKKEKKSAKQTKFTNQTITVEGKTLTIRARVITRNPSQLDRHGEPPAPLHPGLD